MEGVGLWGRLLNADKLRNYRNSIFALFPRLRELKTANYYISTLRPMRAEGSSALTAEDDASV